MCTASVCQSVCLSVCLSRGSTLLYVWGHSVQPLPNHFGLLLRFVCACVSSIGLCRCGNKWTNENVERVLRFSSGLPGAAQLAYAVWTNFLLETVWNASSKVRRGERESDRDPRQDLRQQLSWSVRAPLHCEILGDPASKKWRRSTAVLSVVVANHRFIALLRRSGRHRPDRITPSHTPRGVDVTDYHNVQPQRAGRNSCNTATHWFDFTVAAIVFILPTTIYITEIQSFIHSFTSFIHSLNQAQHSIKTQKERQEETVM